MNCIGLVTHVFLLQNCEGGGGEPEHRHGRGCAQGAGDWNPRTWQTVSGSSDVGPLRRTYSAPHK